MLLSCCPPRWVIGHSGFQSGTSQSDVFWYEPTVPRELTNIGHTLSCARYNPIKTVKTSFIGTMNMLGLAKRVKARFLISSTSEVYGDPLEHPQTENYWGTVNPIGERACYDEGMTPAWTRTRMSATRQGCCTFNHFVLLVQPCGAMKSLQIIRDVSLADELGGFSHWCNSEVVCCRAGLVSGCCCYQMVDCLFCRQEGG